MMIPLLVVLMTTPPVHAKKVQIPGLGLKVDIPEPEDEFSVPPWKFSKGDATSDIRFSMRNAEAFTDVSFMATPFQPNLEAIRPTLLSDLRKVIDEELQYEVGELTSWQHPVLGTVLTAPLSVHDDFMEMDFWSEFAFFAIESHGVIAMTMSSMDAEMAETQLRTVLDLLVVTKPALALSDIPAGKIEAPAGYNIELPTGWRDLPPMAARVLSSSRIAGEGPYSGKLSNLYVVDDASMEGLVFHCEAMADVTLEVLDPTKSPQAAENLLTYARVMLRGGRVRIATGVEELFIDSLSDQPVQTIGDGNLEFIHLDTREAYLWRVKGTIFEEPAEAAFFYTNWDDIGLTCEAKVMAGEEGRLGTFDQIMRNISVVDGLEHTPHLSMKARYVRTWPFGHPALQLYWLPLPLLLIGGVLLFRD
jgi:hypothetical protein